MKVTVANWLLVTLIQRPLLVSFARQAFNDPDWSCRRGKLGLLSRPQRSEEMTMNPDAKKTVLRMIPYGIYVLTAEDGAGNIAAATVNWVTQTAFVPPLLVVGVKTDSGAYKIIQAAKTFALNMLGKEHKSSCLHFFPAGGRHRRKAERPSLPQGRNRCADPDRRARRGRMQGHSRGRARRSPHRGRRSRRGPSQPAAGRPP